MTIDWKRFYANGGYINDNSDPMSYDDPDSESQKTYEENDCTD